MTLATPSDLIDVGSNSRAVAAFNVVLTEHLEAFIEAAERVHTGLILQLSQNAVRYHGSFRPIACAILRAAQDAPIPVAVQLDHADDLSLVREAADSGFTSIMYDGSRLDYSTNMATTASVAAELHRASIWVEAELGEIGGKDGVHSATARTDPGEAARFVAETGVDGLAIAAGSSHAMTDQSATLDVELIHRIARCVGVPLVLHGSSGVCDTQIRAAVGAGIRKVNYGTRFNRVFTASLRQHLDGNPSEFDPRAYLGNARSAVASDAQNVLTAVSGTGGELETLL